MAIVITTKPCDARRGPYQDMVDSVPVNPGTTATAPKVPSDVLVG